MTETGLNTVNLSEVNTFQQVLLLFLMILGSAIMASAIVIYVRLNAFETAFVQYKQERLAKKAKRREARGGSHFQKFMPRKLTRARALSDDMNEKAQGGIMSEESKTPTATNKEVHSRADTDSSDTSTAVNDNEASAAERSMALDGVDEEDFGGSTGNAARGRTLQVENQQPIGQCPSQSPAGRDSAHEDHVASPHIQWVPQRRPTFQRHQTSDQQYRKINKPLFSFTGPGASHNATLRPRRSSDGDGDRPPLSAILPGPLRRAPTLRSASTAYDQKHAAKWTAEGWISRNSQFHDLTLEEREILGGKEYKCVVFLSFLVPFYFIMWNGLGALSIGAWVNNHAASVAYTNGQKPWWTGSFNAVSAFGNSGMSLLDANMVAFQDSPFMLLSLGVFILAGNTAYPIFLRAAVWTIWRFIPKDDPKWMDENETLRFLLDHPRRVYTNMFPSRHTWWLFAALVLLNGLDWMFFEVLSINDTDIQNLSHTARILGGLFQAFAVRSGGFYVVPIPTLRLSLQFLYVIMMYISVYPVTMTIRNSNVYEERSLGIFAEDVSSDNPTTAAAAAATQPDASTALGRSNSKTTTSTTASAGRISNIKRRMTNFAQTAAPAPSRETRSYFMRQQLRAQLAHDAWFAVLAIFLILIIEMNQLERDPVHFSVFNIIFEVISAYSTVGMSVGVSDNAYSFCGSWHTLSKLILCCVMLRGRHRGLPVAIDHAVQLPGTRLWQAEDEDGERRMEKVEANDRAVNLGKSIAEGGSAGVASGQMNGTPIVQSPGGLLERRRQLGRIGEV